VIGDLPSTVVTSPASLTITAIMTGAGGQGAKTPASTTVVDSSGNIGVGTATPSTYIDGAAGIEIEHNGSVSYSVSSFRNSAFAGNVTLQHARGTQSSPSAINSGDRAGTIYFSGWNASAAGFVEAAEIAVTAVPVVANMCGTVTFGFSSLGSLGAEFAECIGTPSNSVKVGLGVGGLTPGYTLDLLDNNFGQTASSRVANASNAGATFDTTAGALSSYGVYAASTSTRSAGSNALTNVGIYATASGAQTNLAAIFAGGDVQNGLGVHEQCTHGSNATCGVVALSSGTVTVSTTAIATLATSGGAGDAVRLTMQGACTGNPYVGAVSSGTSFVINSTVLTDSCNVFWEIVVIN
jgi:hypothetical protein